MCGCSWVCVLLPFMLPGVKGDPEIAAVHHAVDPMVTRSKTPGSLEGDPGEVSDAERSALHGFHHTHITARPTIVLRSTRLIHLLAAQER